ncbi:hypothetical protein TNCV_2115681 [Trichonephila clavipes]|nr:hypothetical protein TNCV_2115681 [Trichonephila clavipes]
MYSSALSIEIISDVEFSRRLVESRSDRLKQEKTTQLGNINKTTQQEKTTHLGSRNEQLNSAAGNNQLLSVGTKQQLNSSVGTKQLNSALPSTAYNRLQPPSFAYNRLQPPTTACNHCNRLHRLHRLYSRIGFFYLLSSMQVTRMDGYIFPFKRGGNSISPSSEFCCLRF